MFSFLNKFDFGARIMLLIVAVAFYNIFLLGYVTRDLPWSNFKVVLFLISHAAAISAFIVAGVKITTEHALGVIEDVRESEKASYNNALDYFRRRFNTESTRPASTPDEVLQTASELLKRDARQWREEQGHELSGLPHRLASADSEEVMPAPVSFVAEEADHEGPGDEEDGPWFEGVHPDPDEPAEEEIDPSTADGPFVSGTRQNGPMGERSW